MGPRAVLFGMRVVSLIPSATETLCRLGGSAKLVGRSHECDFPSDTMNRPVLTSQTTEFTTSSEVDATVSASIAAGTPLYRLNEALLRELRPDVILTQDLCQVCSIDLDTVRAVAASMSPQPRIVSVNPETFEDVLDDVLTIGEAVGLTDNAESLVVDLRERFYRTSEAVPSFVEGPSVAFLEWTDPVFVGGHWTPQLIDRAGASHTLNPTFAAADTGSGVAAQLDQRIAGKSVRVSHEDLVVSRPEAVIVCPCGLDLAATRRAVKEIEDESWWRELPAVKSGRVALVDGNQMFNRPGPRLVDAFEWLVGWLNDRPELIPQGFPWESWK